jgi:ribosomal protein L18E
MRTPKLRGFHNRWKKRFAVLNLTRLNRFENGAELQPESLLEAGLIKDVGAGIKILGTGDLRRKLVIHAHQFSAEARRKIEAAGGTAAVIEVPAPIRPKTKRAKNQPKPVAPVTVETEPSAAEGDTTPAKGSKKAKAEKGAVAEKGTVAEKGAVAEKREKPEKGQKGGKDQAVRASGTEDSGKPDKGKKKS